MTVVSTMYTGNQGLAHLSLPTGETPEAKRQILRDLVFSLSKRPSFVLYMCPAQQSQRNLEPHTLVTVNNVVTYTPSVQII